MVFDPFARPPSGFIEISKEDFEYLSGEPKPLGITIPITIEEDEDEIMTYKAIVISDAGIIQKVILAPENAAESVAEEARNNMALSNIYVEIFDTITCKSAKDFHNKT